MWSSLRRTICRPYDTHCSIRGTEPVVRGGRFRAMSGLVFSAAIPIRLPIALIASMRANSRPLPFCANDVGKIGGNHSLHAPTRANIPTSPYGSRRFRTMEHAKLANGSGHKPIGHSPSSVRKKTDREKAEPARSLRKEMGSKSKPEKLVCRYCGSDDLAPSFIKRRDRRCRKCFSKRYGSAARARKAKVKK
jgi:hypothetical protein